jgi:hypothetical protein
MYLPEVLLHDELRRCPVPRDGVARRRDKKALAGERRA